MEKGDYQMNIIILGAAGFIGTNLAIRIANGKRNKITLVDKSKSYFSSLEKMQLSNITEVESPLDASMDFKILQGQDVVYHLVSTNVPTNSNQHILQEIEANVIFSANLFEACKKYGIKKVVFVSSGGNIYGKESK